MKRKAANVERFLIFFFKQKTAYEIRNCDWSSDVCSSDLKTQANGVSSLWHERPSSPRKEEESEVHDARGEKGDRKSVV